MSRNPMASNLRHYRQQIRDKRDEPDELAEGLAEWRDEMDEAPELTDEMLARARPASEVRRERRLHRDRALRALRAAGILRKPEHGSR